MRQKLLLISFLIVVSVLAGCGLTNTTTPYLLKAGNVPVEYTHSSDEGFNLSALDYSTPSMAVHNWLASLRNNDITIFEHSLSQEIRHQYLSKGKLDEGFKSWRDGVLSSNLQLTGKVSDLGKVDGGKLLKSVHTTNSEQPSIKAIFEEGEWRIEEF